MNVYLEFIAVTASVVLVGALLFTFVVLSLQAASCDDRLLSAATAAGAIIVLALIAGFIMCIIDTPRGCVIAEADASVVCQ